MEFAGRAVDGFHPIGRVSFIEQHNDLVQCELKIGGGGDGDLLARLRRLHRDKQASENQQPCCKSANCCILTWTRERVKVNFKNSFN